MDDVDVFPRTMYVYGRRKEKERRFLWWVMNEVVDGVGTTSVLVADYWRRV